MWLLRFFELKNPCHEWQGRESRRVAFGKGNRLNLTVELYHRKAGKTMAAQRFFEIGSQEFVVNFRVLVRGGFQAHCQDVKHRAKGATIDDAFSAFLETLPDAWVDGVIDSLPVDQQRQVRL